MSKMIVPTPTECACCHKVDDYHGTLTLNSHRLLRIGLPEGWVALATNVDGHQVFSFVCGVCNSKGLSP